MVQIINNVRGRGENMKQGTVKWWNDSKGYGFLTDSNGEDVFVHFSVLQMEGFKTLHKGQRVKFNVVTDKHGLAAKNVHPIEDNTPLPQKSSLIKNKQIRLDGRKLKVFICHSSDDKDSVRDLFDSLNAVPYVSPWLDEKNLLPGQDWNFEITQAVRDAECVLVCLSNNSINKEGYVQKEISFALDVALEKPEDTIYLIPVRLEPCQPPPRLERWHYVDLFSDEGYERLLLSLQYRATNLGLILSP